MRRSNLRILITAGPTREYIDPVRYISNDSSGKMGFALAKAAKKMGMAVQLVTGPVNLPTPKGVARINVISAKNMHREVLKRSKTADIIIMAAAVADWRPVKYSKVKLKRAASKTAEIKLAPNKDILAELGRKKRKDQVIVGFALETDNLEKNARAKLKTKNCDFIVANKTSAVGSDKNSVIIFEFGQKAMKIGSFSKDKIAEKILRIITQS